MLIGIAADLVTIIAGAFSTYVAIKLLWLDRPSNKSDDASDDDESQTPLPPEHLQEPEDEGSSTGDTSDLHERRGDGSGD